MLACFELVEKLMAGFSPLTLSPAVPSLSSLPVPRSNGAVRRPIVFEVVRPGRIFLWPVLERSRSLEQFFFSNLRRVKRIDLGNLGALLSV